MCDLPAQVGWEVHKPEQIGWDPANRGKYPGTGSRMKQRVEDLERQVDTFRLQAQQARAQSASEDGDGGSGGGHGEKHGNTVPSKDYGAGQGSAGPAAAQAEERPTTITVNTKMAAPRGRKRMKRADNDSRNAEAGVRRSSDGRSEPLVETTRNGAIPAGQTQGIATTTTPPPPRPDVARRASSHLVAARGGQEQASRTPQQHQPQDGDADPAHAHHSQDLEPLLPDELPQGPAQPLLSPPNNNSSNAYIHPGLLSPTHHHQGLNGAPAFAPPYFSPNIPNLAMSQSPFSGCPMVPLNPQGQYPGPGQEWPWPLQLTGHDGRRVPYGQQGLIPGELPVRPAAM